MFKKILPYINIGLASIMLFLAMPNLSFSATATGELFWVIWTILCLVIIAANGNILLMSKEKKERLQQIKRARKLKQEQKLLSFMKRKKVSKKDRVNQTG